MDGTRLVISHVAFLRAINTGGRRISNVDLVSAAERLGYREVRAYQASGNVFLGGELPAGVGPIAKHLSAGLSDALGYDVPAIVRSADEVRAIARALPFGDALPAAGSKPQVMLVAEPPALDVVAKWSTLEDRLGVVESEIHWWPTSGISASNLDVRGLEEEVGTMTVRTLGTIERISARIG